MDYEKIVTAARDNAIEALETGLRAAQAILDENDRLQEEIDSGRWSDDVIHAYRSQQDRNKIHGLERARNDALKNAISILTDAEQKIRQGMLPDAKNLSDDYYLLNCGLRLTSNELTRMFSKEQNQNSTMKRLILQYAEEAGLDLPIDLRTWDDGSRAALAALDAYRGIAKQLCYQGSVGSPIKSHFQAPNSALRSGLVRKCFQIEEA